MPRGQAGLHAVSVHLSLFVCPDEWFDIFLKNSFLDLLETMEEVEPWHHDMSHHVATRHFSG